MRFALGFANPGDSVINEVKCSLTFVNLQRAPTVATRRVQEEDDGEKEGESDETERERGYW